MTLVILSHGSRHPHAEAGVEDLARGVDKLIDAPVRVAHLEFSPNTLAKQLADVDHAIVVPLLFAGGYHARYDVPKQLAAAGGRAQLAEGLGAGEDMALLVAERVVPGRTNVLFSVGSSLPEAQEAIQALARRIAELTGEHMEFISATNMKRSLVEVEAEYGPIHVVPLFVTEGLLLDRARAKLGPGSTCSPPLGAALAEVVAARYHAA